MTRKERRNNLLKIIEKNPGIQFRELMRCTGLKNGVLSHHLAALESIGSVQVKRRTRETRFFPLEFSEYESKVIKALRRETPRSIIQAMIYAGKILAFNQIVADVSKSPSTVSFYLSQLIEDGIVEQVLSDRKRKFKIKDKLIVDKLIEDYMPGLLDKPSSGFEDVIISL